MEIENLNKANFTKTVGYEEVSLFYLKNKNGFACHITNYGARIVSLFVPIDNQHKTDIVLGTIQLMIIKMMIFI